MSSYWKKKLEELEGNTGGRGNSSSGLTEQSSYWQKKLADLEEQQRKVSSSVGQSTTTRKPTWSDYKAAKAKQAEARSNKGNTTDQKRTWFDTTVFDDGFQLTDIPKFILGTQTDVSENVMSAVLGIGEKAVDAFATMGAYQTQQQQMQAANSEMMVRSLMGESVDDVLPRYQQFIEDNKKGTAEFVAKDLYDEEAIAKKIISDPVKMVTGVDSAKDSILGEKSDALVQSAANLGVQLGVNAIAPGSGMALMGVTTFGSESENALRNGATLDEAALSGMISAGAELLTEKIGGISFGGKTLTDAAIDALSKRMTGKLANVLLKTGKFVANASAEGFEEIASGYLSAIGQKLTYMEDKEIEELFSSEDRLESFIGGVVLGGAGEVGDVIKSSTTGRDYLTGYTKDEQAVLDKVVEEAIKEEEAKTGKELTAKEKRTIKETMRSNMRNGSLSIEKIEEILGGDSYKTFIEAREALRSTDDYKAYEDASTLQDRYDALRNKDNKTLAERQEEINLKRKIDAASTSLKDLQAKLSPEALKVIKLQDTARAEVMDRVKDSYLAESYREYERSKQKLDIDISKYTDEYAKKTVQTIIDGGYGNNSNAFKATVDLLAKLSADQKLDILASDSEAINTMQNSQKGKDVHGFFYTDENGKHIVLNMDSPRLLQTTVGHEISHVLENAKVSKELSEAVKNYAISKEGLDKYNARIKEAEELYKGDVNTTPESEVVADLIGEYIFTDADFVNNLSAQNQNLFMKIFDEIKYMCKIATAGSKEARELERVKKLFEAAYRQTANGKVNTTVLGGVKYKISDLEIDRINIKFGDTQAEDAAINEKVADLVSRGKVVPLSNESIEKYKESANWSVYKEVRQLLRDVLEPYHGISVEFKHGDQGDVAYLTSTGVDHAVGGPASPKKIAAYEMFGSLVENAEYVFSSENDEHTDTNKKIDGEIQWDTFVAVGTVDGEPYPIAFKIRSLDVDLRSQIYEIAAKKETGFSREDGTQENPANAHSSYGTSPISGETVAQVAPVVKSENSKYMEAVNRGDTVAAQRMVDEAANAAGYATKGYHGSRTPGWTVAEDYGWLWFARDEAVANGYGAQGEAEKGKPYNENGVYAMHYNLGNNLEIYADGASWGELPVTEDEYPGVYVDEENGFITTNAMAEWAEQNGYDSITFVDVDDGGLTTVDVVFNPNKDAKSADPVTYDDNGEVIPLSKRFNTESADIRFSISKTVEETKDLVALHNLTEEKLLKSLELGGLPMPSIAVTKADIPHDNFGEITLIMGKDTIDPKANKKNVVYSADAWTPVFPQVEYEADSKVVKQVNSKLLDLAIKVDDVFKHDLDMMRYSHEDNLNRHGGEEGLIQYAMEKYGFKAAYLEDQGHHIEKITKQVAEEKKYNTANEAKYQAVVDILGVTNAAEVGKLNLQETIDQYGDMLEEIYPGITKTAMRMGRLLSQVKAYMEDQGGEPVYRTVTDESAMRKAVDDAIDMEGFEAWTRKLFSGIVKDKGIYNNKDLYTASGNRKSFKQTHLPFTLENIVKAMATQNGGSTKNVSGFNGVKTLRAGTAERFKSIKAMHERKGRLQHLTQAEADKINDDLSSRLYSIMETIDNENGNKGSSNSFIRLDSIGETLMEISESGKYNEANIQGVFAKYSQNISDTLAADIKQLLFDISQMPVNIYEAKPERAVTFDEVGVFVIPRNAGVKLKQELLNRGYSIAEYDPSVEGDRNKVVNQFEEYKFSLSNFGETPSSNPLHEDGRYLGYRNSVNEFIRDIPVREDIGQSAPVAERDEIDIPIRDDLFPDDNASYQQMLDEQEELSNLMRAAIDSGDIEAVRQYSEEYEAIRKKIAEYDAGEAERFNSLDDADAPPIRSDLPSGSSDSIALSKNDLSDIAANVRSQLGLSNKQMYDVHKLIEEYAQDGLATKEDLFEALKEKFGTYTENLGTDEAVRDAKKYLRTNGLHVAESIVREIPDFAALRRANRGRIRFSTNGTPVDVLYHELNSLYPHLFPEDIIAPTDMLMQMVEVAGMDSAMKEERRVDDSVLMGVAEDIASYVDDLRYTQREEASGIFGESFDNLLETADQYIPAAEDDDIPSIKPAEKATESPVPEKTAAQKTAEQVDARIEKLQSELDANRQNRAQSAKDYDAEIAELQAKYDALANKNSLKGNDILRSIERKKRLKATNDANYEKRITSLEERIEKMSSPEYRTAEQRRSKMQEHTDFWETLLGDTSTWKDMALGIAYKTKTLRRILRTVVRGADGKPDIAKADAIYDALETKYDHNEAQLKKESVKLKEVFKKLNLNSKEDTYAHMLGEFRHNPQTTLTEDVVNEYYEKHKKQIDVEKVNSAITEARKTFDELIVRVNEVLREQGMKEIPYRQGYFPHFTNPKQNWVQKLFNWKPVDNEIPTSIAGITEMFDPQRSWQGFNKQRKGDATDYSLYQGLDTYIHGALDWIYHIDDLQSRRALENHIRYVHSEEGIKARIDEIKANEQLDADEVQTQIEAVLAEAKNPLNNLVTELRARTNTLANKKSSMDRGMEEATNRKIYSTMTNLNNRINANMVVGSISSALTNFIPIVQSWHQVSPVNTVRGVRDLVRSAIKDDGMVAKSDFLTNRLVEEEKLYQTGWDKASNKAAWLMNVIDNISSQTVWRSKYLQNMQEGMSEVEAIKDADQFAKNVIAGRSRGNMPSIFDSKNPLIKMATAFQLEVANQYGFMFEDTPQDVQSKARLVKGYATAFIGAYVYNALYSSLVGRDAAFDPISIIEDLLRDFGLFDDDEEEEPEDIALNFLDNVLDELPFVSGLTGGGRIPLSSAIPYEGDYESLIKDISNGEVSTKELLKPLYYLALPFGGGQIKKTNEGLAMFDDDLPVSGSYTDSGKLRFPVEDTFGNKVQAALFGQYASKNARDYFDNDRSPLGANQIKEYQQLDIPIRDYWEIREGLAERSTTAEKIAYIGDLDLPIRKQNTLANNIVDRKTPIDMTDWDKYASYEEFDFAEKNPEKYDFLVSEGVSVAQYNNLPQKKKDAYDWAFENPEKHAVSKLVTDNLVEYREYATKLNEIKADKTASGQTVSGSAKTKKLKYINGLDLDYGAKLILFKSEYPSDDTYNREIVEYVNDQSYTFEEKAAILRELGFTVTSNGTVTWK